MINVISIGLLPTWVKFVIAILYDMVDFLIPPGIGSIYDIIGIPLGYAMWGPLGLVNAWELLEPTDVLDSFVPTMTIAGLVVTFGGK